MSDPARRPHARRNPRAGPGEYLFDLAKVNHILGGPDYSTANGACVEGERMIVGLMRMAAGNRRRGAFASQRAVDLHPRRHVPRQCRRQGRRGQGRQRALHPLERRAFGQGDGRSRRGVLHRQGRLAQPARHKSGVKIYSLAESNGKNRHDPLPTLCRHGGADRLRRSHRPHRGACAELAIAADPRLSPVQRR